MPTHALNSFPFESVPTTSGWYSWSLSSKKLLLPYGTAASKEVLLSGYVYDFAIGYLAGWRVILPRKVLL